MILMSAITSAFIQNTSFSMEVEHNKILPNLLWEVIPADCATLMFSYLEDKQLLKLSGINQETYRFVDHEFSRRAISLAMPLSWLIFSDLNTWSESMKYFFRQRTHEYFLLGMWSLQYAEQHGGDDRGYITKYLRPAAQSGHALAQLHFGAYLLGKDDPNHKESAINCFRMASDRGEMGAQWRLGQIYYEDKNFVESINYYKLSAAQGHIHSQFNLGYIFQQNGDVTQAKQYYQMAADQESLTDQAVIKAQVNLGLIFHAEGNIGQARKYWELAAAQGNTSAKENMKTIAQ